MAVVIERLALDPGDEARLLHKPDGWYVEVQVDYTLRAAGPADEEAARAIWASVVSSVKKNTH